MSLAPKKVPWANAHKGYLFSVKPGVKVFEISSLKDEEHFKKYYMLDYNKVAEDFHALHLNEEYLKHLSKSRDLQYKSHFYLWFVECTWWFNVKYLELQKVISGKELQTMADRDL